MIQPCCGAIPGASDFSFERVLAPVSVGDFVQHYFEQRMLLIRRGQPDYYQSLLSIAALDTWLNTTAPRHPEVALANAVRAVPLSTYVQDDRRIDLSRLFQAFHAGSTIVLNQMQNRLPPLRGLCRGAEQALGYPFQTNLYLSPPSESAQGFKTHYDTHDVLVLQVEGRKRWRLYGQPITLPLAGQGHGTWEYDPGPVSQDFVLEAGDLLYLPRGLVHDAVTVGSASLHITFGVMAKTWAEFLIEALARHCLEHPALRAALPVNAWRTETDRDAFAADFRARVEAFAAAADPLSLLEAFAADFVTARPPLLAGQFGQLAALDRIDAETPVRPRPGLFWRLVPEPDATLVRLDCPGTELTLPAACAAAVVHALTVPSCTAADLPPPLDAAGRLALVRRLVKDGVLVADLPPPAAG